MNPEHPVPDVLGPNLTILFIGYNPGFRSAAIGHHFAGPSNRFWKLLAASGLTPRRYRPEEDHDLLALGYGVTNIVHRMTRTAAEITREEFRTGRERLLKVLAELKPRIACYEGVGIYRELGRGKEVACGQQTGSVVPGVLDFVVPSPSGLNRIPYEEQLKWHLGLRSLRDSVQPGQR